MSKYLSYKHRHILRRITAMVFAVILALSPLQAIAMAESSYFSPIESTSIEWESISLPEYPEGNNEEINTPSDNYPSETATDEDNSTDTGTEESPSNDETPLPPATGDDATDEPSDEEATDLPTGDDATDMPSEDATDEPSDSDDATEPGTDDATDEPTEEEPTEEEPTEEPTDEDLLGLLPILIPPVAFSGNATHWTVNFWADSTMSTVLGYFQTEIDEVTTIAPEHWPTPSGTGNFIGWYVYVPSMPSAQMPVDPATMLVEDNMDLYPRFVETGGILRFLDVRANVIATSQVLAVTDDFTPPLGFQADIPVGTNIMYWFNVADENQRFFHIDDTIPNPPLEGLVVLRPRYEEQVQVQFNSHGGTPVSSISVWPGAAIARPTDPTRHGWEFLHWSLTPGDEYNTTAFDFGTQITDNTILHAIWYNEYEILPEFILEFFRSGDNAFANLATQTSWFENRVIVRPDAFPSGEYPFRVGDVLTEEQVLQIVEMYHPINSSGVIRGREFTPIITAGRVRQSEPLNAEGTATIFLLFAPVIFDMVIDLSQEPDDVALTFDGITYNNSSVIAHTFETHAAITFLTSHQNHRFPTELPWRTQAQINANAAILERPGRLVERWQWTDGAFTNIQNADGTWGVAHGRSGFVGARPTLPNGMASLDPSVRQTITMRPIWMSTDERLVTLHARTFDALNFGNYRELSHINPNGTRHAIPFSDFIDGTMSFDEVYSVFRTVLTVVHPVRSIPYFTTVGGTSMSIVRESDINSDWYVVWNDDRTVAIRFALTNRGAMNVTFNPAAGFFPSGAQGLNVNTGFVAWNNIANSWPILLNRSTMTTISPPVPNPPNGQVFVGWYTNPTWATPVEAPEIDPYTGLFITNGTGANSQTLSLIARYVDWPPEFIITDGMNNRIHTHIPNIESGRSLAGAGYTVNDFLSPEDQARFTSGVNHPGRGEFHMWGVFHNGRAEPFLEEMPLNAGLFMLFPIFNMGQNVVTFHGVDGSPTGHTRTVFTDSGNVFTSSVGNNTIARGGGTNRSMPPIPGTIPANHRFVWTTQPNGGGTVFNQNTPVTEDISVYAFFEPFATITHTVRDWTGSGDTGNSAILPLPQRVPARFGVVQPATVAPVSGWQFYGWFRSDAYTSNVFTNITSLAHQAVQINNDFQEATYEARFKAILNFQPSESGGIPLGTVSETAPVVLFPNETAPTVIATPANASISFVNWTDVDNNVVGTNPTLTLTGTLLPNTFTANFIEHGNATINYHVAPTPGISATGGQVTPAMQGVARYGTPDGASVSVTFDGFEFIGWSVGNNPSNIIAGSTDPNATFEPSTPAKGYWYVDGDYDFFAHFREVPTDVTIQFQVPLAQTGRGTVSPASQNLRPVTGIATEATSTATAAPGFVFAGWSLTPDGAIIDDNATRTPARQSLGTGPDVFASRTYYAQFNEYDGNVTIRYTVGAAGGGTVNLLAEDVTPLSNPQALQGSTPEASSGWEFSRWSSTADGTGLINSQWWNNENNRLAPQPTVPAGGHSIAVFQSTTFYAIFTPIAQTITYNLNYGTQHASNPDTFNVTQTVTLHHASRANHIPLGWYTTSNFAEGTRVTQIGPNHVGNIELWARWQGEQRTITYQSGTGSGADHVVDVRYGDTYTILIEVPSGFTAPTGHHFNGWTRGNTSATGTINVTDNVVLVAEWEPNPHTITFVSLYQTSGTPPSPINTHWGTNINVPATPVGFTRDGHTFGGWRLNDTTTILQPNDPIPTITSDVTLTAVWNINRFTVTYTNNLAVGTVAPHNNVDWNTNVTVRSAETLTREGHNFVNWLIEGTINTINPNEPLLVTEDVTLVAQWQIRQYRVTLESGTGEGAAIQQPLQNWGTTIVLPEVPLAFSKEGHHFIGWRLDGNAANTNPGNAGPITGNRTATAQWAINSHTLTYVGNGHTGGDVPTLEDFNWNELVTVAPQGNLARDGHTFLGWATTANATASNVGATFNMPDDDKTLYAVWQINTHSVTYDIGAEATGTTPTQSDVDWNTSITTADDSDFSRVGHTFGGWINSVGGATVAVNTSLNIRSDVILTAIWNPIDYRVDFNENLQGSTLGDVTGFVPDSMTSVHYNATVDVPANENSLSRTGHTLLGWDRNANATTPEFPLANASNNSFTMPASNVTLYAIWEIQEREVIFINNHNATDNTEHGRESTDYGSTLTLPTPPSRTGYDFVGWFTARTGGTQFIASTVVREDTTVYARWQAHSHTITFAHDLAGGTGALPATIPTYFDEVETVPGQGSMVRNGYTFVGWRDSISNSVLTENAPLTVSGNHVLTAVWSRDGRFAVIYNANWPSLGDQDGQVPTSAYGNDYYTSQTVTVLDNNTLEVTGHTFLGWSRDANATTPDYVDGNTFAMGTTHVTLYAVWQIQERTLTYSVGTGAGTPPPAQTVNWSSPVTVSGQGGMSKEGHTFGDWTDADGNPVAEDAVLSLTANMTLTAVWNINSYNVTYNANITGGAGAGAISGMPSPTTVSIVFGETHNITATPSRVGHTFAGWATSPTATASDVVTSITMVVGGVNLYAVWTPINYAVTFDLNLQGSNLGTIGGAVPNAITGRNYTNVVTVPVNENSLTRTGHTLLGWSRNANATTATYVADDTFNMPAYDVTLYAVWQRQTREVTFIRNHDADDNTQATSVTVLYGASLDAIMPAELTRSGHDSLGWFDTRTGGIAFTASTVVTSNKNVYAQWQIQDRTITFANHETAEFIGGDLPSTITVDYGAVVSIPDVGITRRGYEFTVWTDADDTEFASGDNWPLYEDLELTANWNRLERFAVMYNANDGILGNLSGDTPAGGDDYLPGETVTVLGYNTLERTGHTFLGWSTDNNATIAEYVEGETFAMLDANVTLYAVWQINQHEVTVRHNIFAWDETYTDAIEYAYETFIVYYGDSFEADIMDINDHIFRAAISDAYTITMGDAPTTINLYYQQYTFEVSLTMNGITVNSVNLEINEQFPMQTEYNTLTEQEFLALFDVATVNLDENPMSRIRSIIPAPVLSAPDFADVDFHSVGSTDVTIYAVWTTGQAYSLTVTVNIENTVAPTLYVANPVLEFFTDNEPASMQAIIDAFGITAFSAVDGYLTNYTVAFVDGYTFDTINWSNAVARREYGVLISVEDLSGNKSITEIGIVAIHVVPASERPGENQPPEEPGNNLPPSGGGSELGDNDSNTGSDNGDSSNNNNAGGNNNDVENDNNNDTTNNDTNNQDETESNDVDEDTTPETTLPESPATPAPTAPTTSVVEAEAPVSEIATESAPLPLTTADNMIQYGDMWIELDDAGVPLGAWNWDEETEMWIFDENVPLGVFATAAGAGAVLGAASTMPETGLTSNVGTFAIFIAFALVIATAAFVLIKREQKNRNA